MSNPRPHRAGFTLVEILIVVVILGILAAIVIPQFTNASESAKSSSLVSQLQTIRSQLELYQVQHNGSYPTLAQLWGNMTTKTNSDGSTTGTPTLGPYLQQDPVNALQGASAVVISSATPTATTGWLYDATTGSIKAAVPAAKFTALGLSSNDAVSY